MKPRIKFTIITLFPEALEPYLSSSMLFKARERGIIAVEYVNLREFGLGPHRSVDDTPYGGGDGMLLRCEPAFAAIESVRAEDPGAEVIIPTPVGEIWNQEMARRFAGISVRGAAEGDGLTDGTGEAFEGGVSDGEEDLGGAKEFETRHYVIFCPHYEGYDERILTIVDHKISLGNYILTGGELAAMILVDSITRLLPGVLGGATSAEIESFSDGDNLEFPQYTKPAEFRGMKVPEVLLSGHHQKIEEWRRGMSGRRSEA